MSEHIIFIALLFLVTMVFVFTHLKPLSNNQIQKLANKTRNKRIKKYFSFDSQEYLPDKEFKKKMNPKGKFYNVNETLFEFPSVASSLLKYKKHEWIIIAFEKNESVKLVWVNKGTDRNSVSLKCDIKDFVKTTKHYQHSSFLIFHNHPNSNPNKYQKISPSESDISSAQDFANVLDENNINLLEFVCERGRHYIYYKSICSSFLPIKLIIEEIEQVNGISKAKNLKLHLKRIF